MNIEELCEVNFKDINVMKQTWQNEKSFSYKTSGRPCFGICYILSGAIKYKTEYGDMTATVGDTVILKQDAQYLAVFEGDNTSDILINFTCDNHSCFDESPITVIKNKSVIKSRFFEILQYSAENNRRCMVKSTLYAILDGLIYNEPNSAYMKIKQIIDEDCGYTMNETEIAEKCSMSISSLQRIFKKYGGKTVSEYRNECRLAVAKELLSEERYTVEEIADKLGFYDSAYFSRCFKKNVGISPKKFVKQYYRM